MLAIGLMGPAVAEAKNPPVRGEGNPWAELMGENTAEMRTQIDDLERKQSQLEARVARLELELTKDDQKHARQPGLHLAEEIELTKVRVELAQVSAEIERLEKRHDKGLESKSKAVRGVHLDPTLDLSPKELGSKQLARYFEDKMIGFKDGALHFDWKDGTPDNARGKIFLTPDMVSADFFLTPSKDDTKTDLTIVFTLSNGAWKTIRLEDGYLMRVSDYYDSDAEGKPVTKTR